MSKWEILSREEDGLYLGSGISLRGERNLFPQPLVARCIKLASGMYQQLLITCGTRPITAHGPLREVFEHGAVFSQESKDT